MHTPPADLPDEVVLDTVRAWVPSATSATYLPVGYGSHHWEVSDAHGRRWFASVDELRGDASTSWLDAAFSVAHAARAAGVAGVHAPLADGDGVIVRRVRRGWVVSVQDWLEGSAGRFSDRYTTAQVEELLVLLAGLHDVRPDATRALRDGNRVPGRADLEMWLARLDDDRAWTRGPYGERVRRLVRAHEPALTAALAGHDGRVLRAAVGGAVASRAVPTHGEPHPGNVVHGPEGLRLVDWDTALVAEPERDLWLLAVRSDLDVADRYEALSGRSVDRAALAHHERRWALADVAEFVPLLAEAAEETEDTEWQCEALEGVLTDVERLSTRGP